MSLSTVPGLHFVQNCKAEYQMVGCRLEYWGIMVRFSAGATDFSLLFSLLHRVHPTSYVMDFRGSFLEGRAVGA